ncbi:MAG: hemolysin III family protein, partial [Gluconacetobacter diazotrophicus]|nr:hemolysin III family protein [Gluconacetobacter diazotrophicus]
MVLVLGVAAVLVGAALLLHAAARLGRIDLIAIASYLLGLLASFSISTVYNMAPLGRLKSRLRRYDHAAIFLLIAGTYTAIAGLSLPSSWSLPLLGLVWSGAVVGMALKLFAVGRHERLGLVLYLGLGWVGIVAL